MNVVWVRVLRGLGFRAVAGMAVFACVAGAATGGSLAGTVSDATGAVLPGVTVTLTSESQHTVFKAQANAEGFYSFPNLPVGLYDLAADAGGFAPLRRLHVAVDADAAVRYDLTLVIGPKAEAVTVSAEGGAQIDLTSTHLGEVISSGLMTALPLNGRSYTDLLALQPGVSPISTLLPSSVVMAGVTGSLDPSGDLNPGNLSINGQRESANGFLVNGIDVQEHMNGGTSVIPNLDSIEQFRLLTNSFDPEYGNYNGGIVTVISKSGTGEFHGSAFEFFRNTALDARGYFDPMRPAFRQNQFGATMGGPVEREKLFFFADYQGTRTTQGISTGNLSVPSLAERAGSFMDLTGCVSGPYLAGLLSADLGMNVEANDPYSGQATGCAPGRPAVFANGTIPQRAWSGPGANLLAYIPPPNDGLDQFTTASKAQTVRDDKGSLRVDSNTRLGQLSLYSFVDDYRVDNPYPGAVAGASLPGFDALFLGRAQVFALGVTTVLGTSAVNELHAGYLRNANIVGEPRGGLGVSLASQGFVTGPNTPGIVVQAPQYEGVQNIAFPSFTMGVPITNETQVNNTLYLSDGLSRVVGPHTLKLGVQLHFDQINEHPNGIFNGTFNVNGTETGDPYADFLLGVASSYQQSSGQPFYLRDRYLGSYGQDSWRVRHDLTLNAGLRWDVIMPFWEKYNQIGTYIPGEQSVLYPGAPKGVVVAGDDGVPRTIAPTSYGNFAPRVGVAYAMHFDRGFGKLLFGETGKSSLRASYGLFYTQFPGLLAGIMYAVPPFGFTYISPGPPLLATPFLTAATGVDNGQRFPFSFPPHSVSAAHPDQSIDWAHLLPFQSDPFFNVHNRAPYLSNVMLSFQREIGQRTLLTASYVGNQAHRIPVVVSVNPGDAALCLSLAPQCGPFGEDNTYTNVAGRPVYGTRMGQTTGVATADAETFGENTSDSTIANSNYNSLETTLRYEHSGSQFLLSYSYAKSIDQGSNIGEQLNPFNPRQSRTISAWDQRQSFVASYTIRVPVERLIRAGRQWTSDWSVSGATRFASGFPVTLTDTSDNSLAGTLGNGVNNYLLDTPQSVGGPLRLNRNGRSGAAAFNTKAFPEEELGQLGNSKRRMFYGPGIDNFDLTLQKVVTVREGEAINVRAELFNAFNHAQFYGPAAVDGQVEDPHYGEIVSAASPRLMQLVAKFSF